MCLGSREKTGSIAAPWPFTPAILNNYLYVKTEAVL